MLFRVVFSGIKIIFGVLDYISGISKFIETDRARGSMIKKKMIVISSLPVIVTGLILYWLFLKPEKPPTEKPNDTPKVEEFAPLPLPEIEEPKVEPTEEPKEPPSEDEGELTPEQPEVPVEEPSIPATLEEAMEILLKEAGELSQNDNWLELVQIAEPIKTFVKAVEVMSTGERPVIPCQGLVPPIPFSAERDETGKLVVSQLSINRFQKPVDALLSLDSAKAAALYTRLEPILDQELHALGYPKDTAFRTTLTKAFTNILETPKLDEEPELVHVSLFLYKYRNEQLEELLPLQKFMLRLGLQNREAIRAKLLEIASQLKLYQE